MEERKEESGVSARSVIPKVILILAFFVGAFLFGREVWKIEFDQTWKSWMALIFGELSFLYSFVFCVMAIVLYGMKIINAEEYGLGWKGTVLILSLAAIIQLAFWGIVCANYELFKAVAVLGVISIIMAVWLKLTSK